jgi:hypothetical protein
MSKSYSLAQVAAEWLPTEWKDPELWLMRRLRRGEITGYKVGHTWRMREQDVEDFIARYLNENPVPAAPAPDPILGGLSARAARRLKAAS